MKAIVNTSLLGDEFKKMSQIINKNTVLPILTCVKLSFHRDKLTIAATDLETTFVSTIECSCKDSFSAIVDFASMLDICKNLNEPVTFELSKNNILVHGDDSKFKLAKGGEEDEFPKIPDEEFLFTIPVDEDFFSAIYRANSCRNKNDDMTTTNTACMDFKKDVLSIVGTDALELYKKDLKIKTANPHQSLVREKFVQSIKEFSNGKLSIGEKFVKIENNGTQVITRVQDNKYCSYDVILPKDIIYNFKAVRIDLMYAIRKASIGASRASGACAINFKQDKITIVAQDVIWGKEGEADLKVIHTVNFPAIGVNGNQLLHILSLMDSDEVEMSITAPTKSIYLKPSDDNSVICLLQPLLL